MLATTERRRVGNRQEGTRTGDIVQDRRGRGGLVRERERSGDRMIDGEEEVVVLGVGLETERSGALER